MAREQAPAFQFYARDWLASGSVAVLSVEERGAYITLLARCWLMVELPLDPDEIAALAGVKVGWWAKHGERVMRQFHKTDTGYRNDRLDEERGKQAAYSEQQSGRAAAGWLKRHGNAGAMPGQCPEDALRTASSSASASASSEKSTSPDGDVSEPPADLMRLIGIWSTEAPSLIQPREWNDARIKALRRVAKKHPDDSWWTDFARRAEASDFLAGRKPGRDGQQPFKAGLFWLLKPENFAKFMDGNYVNRDAVPRLGAGRTSGNAAALAAYEDTLNVD
jgi:uncharacterized protein YdaU (DUF1376 family)